MDYLKQLYGQVRDLFLSMTPGNRIIASLLVAVLVVSLGYLFVGSIRSEGSASSKYTYLYNGLEFTQNEQSAAENAFGRESLSAHEWIGHRLRVPTKSVAKYTQVLGSASVMTQRGMAGKQTAENFGPWESGKMMDEKMVQATALDAANAIMMLPEITSAQVIPNRRKELDRKTIQYKTIPSVSVTVKSRVNKPLSSATIGSIANIVSAAFAITDMKEIKITDAENAKAYNGLGQDTSGGQASYMRAQKEYQDLWNETIYDLLPTIRGLQVRTSIVLSQRINERVFGVQHGKPTVIHDHIRGTDYLRQEADRGGRPGHIAQMNRPLIDPQNFEANMAKTTERTHEEEKSNALQGEELNYEMIPLVPQKIWASLQVPRSYVKKIWAEKHVKKGEKTEDPTDEQLDAESLLIRSDIKRQVENLLNPYRDPKHPDVVDVTEYRDREEEEHVATWQEKVLAWLGEYWQTLGLMGLVLCGLGVLWMITRPAKPEPIVIYESPEIPMEVIEARAKIAAEAAAKAQQEAEDGEDGFNDDGSPRTLESFKSVRSLQEEIAELVEENPDAAAAVLRQWIGNVVVVDNK